VDEPELEARIAVARARHQVVGREWSPADVATLLDIAAGLEPWLAAWVEEIALRVWDALARRG
jgi:hypothetical protein